MIKSALKIYRKNIWDVFAVIGIIAIGILAGILIILPMLRNSISQSYNQIVDAAKGLGDSFDGNKFLNSLTTNLNSLDWANPIKTLKSLFENNVLLNIIQAALTAAGLGAEQIQSIIGTIDNSISTLSSNIINQFVILGSCLLVSTIISFLATKIAIQIRSTDGNHNVFKFICSFLLNLICLCAIYSLAILSILKLKGVSLYFVLVGLFLLLQILTFTISILCYKTKDTRVREILNVKNILLLFLSILIIFAISLAIIEIVFIFSDAIALIISIPLLVITIIITDNIVNAYTIGFKSNKNNNDKTIKKLNKSK